MKFTCDKSVLMDGINIVSKAVAPKSNVPALEGIMVCADDILKLTGNDLEIGIECKIEANIIKKGSCVFNSKIFSDIIRSLPQGVVEVELNTDDYTTIIKCQTTYFEIKATASDEFPEISFINRDNNFKISEAKLKSMIRQTSFSLGTNENRYILTGSLFEIDNDRLSMIAVDGFRLAIRKEKIESNGIVHNMVVPGKTLSELSKLLKDSNETVNIFYNDKNVLFEIENYIVVSRLLEGEFVNYNQILPREYAIGVKTQTVPLVRALERVSLIISSDDNIKSPALFNLKDNKITISCSSSIGKVLDNIEAQISGTELEIGFNYKYMLEATKATEVEEIFIELNTPLSPCVIRPTEGEDFIYIILPVRINKWTK